MTGTLERGGRLTEGSRTGRRRRLVVGFAITLLALAVALVGSVAVGARDVPLVDALVAVFSPGATDADSVAVRDLRLPRLVIGLVAGAALGIAGALMQGLTRNPLADPGLLGVNAGASFFVAGAITWFGVTTASGFVWFAFAGSAVAAVVVYGIGAIGREGATPVKLALAGTAVTAAFTSLLTITLVGDVETLDRYRFWAVGSLVGRDLDTTLLLLPFVAAGALLAIGGARALDAIALGDDVARGLGTNLPLARAVVGLAVVLLCGSATAMAGPLAFVGLVVPHVARRFTGPDYRAILVLSALLGGALLLLADTIGRVIVLPGELEAGLVVAAIGAPLMIAIIRSPRLARL